MKSLTRKCVLTHAAVGRVEDAGVHDDGGTRPWTSHRRIKMATWEVSRAHLYGDVRRWIYPNPLEEYEQKRKLARI